MKTIVLISAFCVGFLATAQDSRMQFSVSGGSTFSDKNQKDFQLYNGFDLQVDMTVNLFKKGWDGSVKGSGFSQKSLSGGVNFSVGYAGLKSELIDAQTIVGNYPVTNAELVISNNSPSKNAPVFTTGLGFQLQYSLGKVVISPILSGGYVFIRHDAQTYDGNFSANGQSLTKTLMSQDEVNKSGFFIKPEIRLGYLVRENLQIFISGAYIAGPKLNYSQQILVPNGEVNPNGTYELRQIQDGTCEEFSKEIKFSASQINIGITLGVGKSISQKGVKRLSMTPTSAKQSTKTPANNNPISETNPENDVGPTNNSVQPKHDTSKGSIGNVRREDVNHTSNNKSIREKGVKKTEQAKPKKKPRGKIVRPGDGGMMSIPGQPIKGVIVKGGKNPGGNNLNLLSDNNGRITFSIKESGMYTLQLTLPEPDSKRVVGLKSKGVKKNEPEAYTSGTPIGGIVVKGGKNPGGNMFNLVTNSLGKIYLQLPEAGNYSFQITTPEAVTAEEEVLIASLSIKDANGIEMPNPEKFTKVINDKQLQGKTIVVNHGSDRYVFKSDDSKIYPILQKKAFFEGQPETYTSACGNCGVKICTDANGNETCYDCFCNVMNACSCLLCIESSKLSPIDDE